MHDLGRVIIREKLSPDSHDALVDVLSRYPRQAGNQVVLAMSEACLGLWPITEADYNVSEGGESQTIKLTLSEDRYPKLYALYKALPRGVKGQTIINLLNRHQLMRQADPGKVNSALNQALLGHRAGGQISLETAEGTMQNDAVVSAEVRPAPQGTSSREAQSPTSSKPEGAENASIVMPAGVVEEDAEDPLAGLPPLTWD